jgi:hypothetical protein
MTPRLQHARGLYNVRLLHASIVALFALTIFSVGFRFVAHGYSILLTNVISIVLTLFITAALTFVMLRVKRLQSKIETMTEQLMLAQNINDATKLARDLHRLVVQFVGTVGSTTENHYAITVMLENIAQFVVDYHKTVLCVNAVTRDAISVMRNDSRCCSAECNFMIHRSQSKYCHLPQRMPEELKAASNAENSYFRSHACISRFGG